MVGKSCAAELYTRFFNVKSQNNFTDENYYVNLSDDDTIKRTFLSEALSKSFRNQHSN